MKQLLAILFGAALAACIPVSTSSTYTPPVTQVQYGTGVYLDGTELSASDKAQLDSYVGADAPPGRYVVANGTLQLEQAAPADQSTTFYGAGAGGQSQSVTRDGDCVMFSSPEVDFAGSGC